MVLQARLRIFTLPVIASPIDPTGLLSLYSVRKSLRIFASVTSPSLSSSSPVIVDISGIGSFDFCDLNDGYQLPGWIDNNLIKIKVWDASENIEYIPEINYTTGSGNWGDIFSVIDQLVVNELSSDINDNLSLFTVYPNPFNPYVTFDIGNDYQNNLNISVYNLLGEIVYSANYSNINQNKIVWDASKYESGIYLVHFSNNNLSLTKKITLIK